jgi:molybdopterin converting factor small subunit
MPATFVIPSALRPLTDGRDRIPLDDTGATVADALAALFRAYPALRDRLLTEPGEVRPHVNIFVGEVSIRETGGLATKIGERVEISIIPAVSGGRAESRVAGFEEA